MKKGKYLNARAAKRTSKKLIALALALVLTIGGVVGGTLAWLTSTTGEVKNTFTPSDINIALTEEAGGDEKEFKMVPGDTFAKDPKVTVVADSEACWLFVAITESDNLDTYITYEVAEGWTKLAGYENIYYRSVAANAADQDFYVLKGDATYTNGVIKVKDTVTKTDMEAIDGKNADGSANTSEKEPTLTFDAAAIQSAHIDSANDAWSKLPTAFTGKAVATPPATP